jgi:NO-binding membrane sensor protein with MHYT domain
MDAEEAFEFLSLITFEDFLLFISSVISFIVSFLSVRPPFTYLRDFNVKKFE